MTVHRSCLLAVALWAAGAAGAAPTTIYRCGPEGREYSQTPCRDGQVIDAADPRSAAQQREGRDVAESQRRLAQQMEAERRQREAAARNLGAAGAKPVAAPAAASAASAPSKRRAKGKPAGT